MISHSLGAVNIQCDYGNCVVVDAESPDSEYGSNWFDDIPGGHIGSSS